MITIVSHLWLAQQSNSIPKFQYIIILYTASWKKVFFFLMTSKEDIWLNYDKKIFLCVKLCKTSELRSKFSSVQSHSHVWLFVTPWTAARQASLSITNSRSLLKLMSIELVIPGSKKFLEFSFQETILNIFCNSLNYNVFMWLSTQIK